MGLSGLEPPTSRLSGVRSNRLSYRPMRVDIVGLFPQVLLFILLFNVPVAHWKMNSVFTVLIDLLSLSDVWLLYFALTNFVLRSEFLRRRRVHRYTSLRKISRLAKISP